MSILINTATLVGATALPITCEVDLLRRLPRMAIVGLPANAVQETAERVRSALGDAFPRQRVIVNLSPADIRKTQATMYDLPIAVGIVAATTGEGISMFDTSGYLFAAELSLSGDLRPVRGGVALGILARDRDLMLVTDPYTAAEAVTVAGARVIAARTLRDVLEHLRGGVQLPPVPDYVDIDRTELDALPPELDAVVQRIASAGLPVLLVGPPGCGKSAVARRVPAAMPAPTEAERIDIAAGLSAAGIMPRPAMLPARPFRAPHHTVSVQGLTGDRNGRLGECNLAHYGVLMLDEAAELPRAQLEAVATAYRTGRTGFPEQGVRAKFLPIYASSPCPCGRYGAEEIIGMPCGCTSGERAAYLSRVTRYLPEGTVTITLPAANRAAMASK